MPSDAMTTVERPEFGLEDVAGELRNIVAADDLTLDAVARKRASEDYAWISPILRERLPSTVADMVVTPRSAEELAEILDVAARHRVPVTPRGKGTGNYGQAVPLHHGLVLDLSGLDTIVEIGDGWIEAGAGANFSALELAARETGQELTIFPSMQRSTLGGFLSGGNQGIGSVRHGSIWDGFVKALTVVPCRPDAEPRRLEGPDCRPHLHTYGTAGIIAGARVALTPAQEWTALFASFADVPQAGAAGLELLELEPYPRGLSIDDADLAATYPNHVGIGAGATSLRAIVRVDAVEATTAVIEAHGGRVTAVDDEAVGLLVTTSFNHSTVRALKRRPELCATQVRGLAIFDRHAEVAEVFEGGLLHLDGNRKGGEAGFSGLLLSPFRGADALYAGMARLRDLGVAVIDPHSWILGGHGGVDEIAALQSEWDPFRLLNPGKLPES